MCKSLYNLICGQEALLVVIMNSWLVGVFTAIFVMDSSFKGVNAVMPD